MYYSDDQQVPSTSSNSAPLSGPSPLTPTHTVMSEPSPAFSSPYRVSDANPLQKVRNQCGIRNPDHLSQWMNNQNGMMPPFQGEMGGFNKPPSRAPSTMSGMSGMSGMSAQMSTMSLGAMSQLSINTQITEIAVNYQPQMSSASSSVENYPPVIRPDQVNYHMRSIINSLGGTTQDRLKAIGSINQLVNLDMLRFSDGSLQCDMIYRIFVIIQTTLPPPSPHNVPNGPLQKSSLVPEAQMLVDMLRLLNVILNNKFANDVIDNVVEYMGGQPIVALCNLLVPGGFYTRRAVATLWMLLHFKWKKKSERKSRNSWNGYVRKKEHFDKLVRIATYTQDISYTARAFAMGILKILLHRDEQCRNYFVDNGGIVCALSMLQLEMDHGVLLETLGLLLCVVTDFKSGGRTVDARKYAERIVHENGVQVLSALLQHASTDVIRLSLHLMAITSDLKLSPEFEAAHMEATFSSILAVLQLLGSCEPRLVMHATSFLYNICANRIDCKRLLIEKQAIEAFCQVMCSIKEYHRMGNITDVKHVVNKVVENSMDCLINLTNGVDPAQILARQILAAHPQIHAAILEAVANKDKMALKAFRLLNIVFETVPDFRVRFRGLVVTYTDPQNMKQTTNLTTAALLFASNCYRNARNVPAVSVREHDALLTSSMNVLMGLAEDEELRREIAHCMMLHNQDLLELVWTVGNGHDQYRILMLRLLEQMTNNGDGAQFLQFFAERNPDDRRILLTLRGGQNQEIAYRCNTLLCRLDSPIPSSVVTSSAGPAHSSTQSKLSDVNLAEAMHPEYML